ncbi:phosphoribosyltransferase family protein [Bacillus tropicus]|uniref:phosphoribosyltransferase family protein n=1 Tax=Bacillus tropicus TaxID=2026188 RepID=UPI0008FDBE76|nr:phosphoribosyltransferase family protein [Bacillus tropicus]MDF9554698.1 phosphoribosyltransferase family protein [Bacillus tropicus]MDF9591045.1 phosphoribosyltransferase family protein [Bacillus tropicus]MDF9648479.1 phosphoribosyltransferase family protein [Bacillus tropicus]OJE41664.1 adenine/guanine phosphoribosyltransferase [Bacillus tropicus]HDR7798685.1 phosphoribosyltransferase family protein [Bacillus tropicus]
MKTNNSPISLLQTQNNTYNVLNNIKVHVEVRDNPYNLELDNLFQMAARINKKRSFLFVSTILGKHLPIKPAVSLTSGLALAARYMEILHNTSHPFQKEIFNLISLEVDEIPEEVFRYQYPLQEEVLFIGFAETATALGHSMFQCFQNANYVHTTRESIPNLESVITFEEEHSHATSHRCYVDKSFFQNNNPIVLVDDEMTTGKTALNIIRSIQQQFPREEYTIASLLDWRSNTNRTQFKQLEEELQIKIHVISLLEGSIHAAGQPLNITKTDIHIEETKPYFKKHTITCPALSYTSNYIKYTGRFGISSYEQKHIHSFTQEAGKMLQRKRIGKRTLCLGTGEFIYIPMKIAAEMGGNILYQSTTRSPIHPVSNDVNYAIHNHFSYPSPEDSTITNYFYNISPHDYDEVFVFMERDLGEESLSPLLQQLQTVIPFIHIVSFSNSIEKEG